MAHLSSSNPSSTWPPFHPQSFTNLALVHQKITQLQAKKVTTKIARVRTAGDIHKIPELTSSIKLDNIHQIFAPITSHDQTQCPMSILIEGHPGIGKTTLAKEMCLQWANDQLLTSDKLVLLLMLRDPNVQKITTTEQLVRYTQSTDQVQCVLSYLQSNNGVGVTLIIDGFDELSTELRQKSFFRKLIEGDVLYNVRVVVTSRPSASACLHQYVHRRIEVLGFEKSSKEQYMHNALKDTPDYLHTLKVHFQQYPNIDTLCYIPLNMAIIVYLCLLGSLPPTATKMYESFILHTICRHLKKIGKIHNDTSITKIEKFPQPVCEVLQQLQKVAFDGLVEDKIVFTVEELPVLCKDDPTCYGLLQSTECYSAEETGTPTQSFNFLHLGVQEYFAAKYVTTLPEVQVYTLLKESFIVTQKKLYSNPNPDSKSVRLSNMWILYCGITSGQCKTLRHYLTTYGKPDPPNDILTPMFPSTTSMMSQRFHPLQSSSINPSYHPVTPPTQPVYSRYPLTPSRDQHITSYPQPHHLPTVYHPYQQQQQLVQYPYHQPSMPSPLSGYTRSHDPISHPMTICRPTITHLHSSHDQMFTPPAAAEEHNNSHVLPSGHTTNDWSSYQRMSNTGTISQDILEDSVKVLYLFQCFQEAQDNVLCEVLSKSFDDGVINVKGHSLLPHQVMSLGFFLSRSHRKWNTLILSQCHIGDHGMSILHQYLCGDITNKQEIPEINFYNNNLTGASSHLIGDIISHLQPHILKLERNNITNVRDISTAVITTTIVKVLDMYNNGLTAQEAIAISDMMICLEELDISSNNLGDHGAELLSEGITNTKTLRILAIECNNIGPSGTTAIANALSNNTSLEELDICNNNLGDHGAELLSEGITNTKTLRVLNISYNNIGQSGTTAIANALSNNTSLEELYTSGNKVGQGEATIIAKAITNNKTLKKLSDHTMDKGSFMILMRSLHCNNTITKLVVPFRLCYDDSVQREVTKINKRRNERNVQEVTVGW